MILGIDASNLRAGGGVTHLVELLRAADPPTHGFRQVIVWGGAATLDRIDDRPWLNKLHDPLLDGPLPLRLWWQRFRLQALARDAGCDLLFAPGGSYSGSFRPFVTMSRNMLPFEASEAARFGWSWTRLRLRLLRFAQARTFARADGMIFLTGYARDTVTRAVRCRRSTVVPHGVNPRFLREPSVPRAIDDCSATRPLQLLYVSIIDMYKHQAQVAEAVADLHATGLPLRLDLVGPAYGPALAHLRATLAQVDPRGQCVHYRGAVPYPSLPVLYHQADLFVFASSCENMPNILLEAMAAGLPIACSNRGPMPEVLGDAGTYFDPERPEEIAAAVRALAESPSLRREKAALAYERAQAYSWQRCARETFGFLEGVVSRR